MRFPKPDTPQMPGADMRADYLARKAASEAAVNADRRSTSPWVQIVRDAYLASPAYRNGLKPMGQHIEREPGEDG
jgi:hypothetical protein